MMSSSTEDAAGSSASRWPQAERLDARRMVSAIQAATGVRLHVDGYCPGGQVGAAYVTWPDGHRSVLTWRPGIRLADLRDGSLAVIGALRPAGYPAPAAELAVQADDAVAVVWELLPGAPTSHFTSALLQEALVLNDLQAGKLAGQPVIPAVDLFLTRDGPGFCLHQPLREHSARTQALHRWITSIGESHPSCLTGDDAVHCDYQPSNILTSRSHISGVVDWDG